MSLIDSDALIEQLMKEPKVGRLSFEAVLNAVKNMEPIEERKTGKAIVKSTGYRGYWACDQCGIQINSTDNFCRHCGADLRGKK